jgi:carbon-monoxide dehydrogenase medium subunit
MKPALFDYVRPRDLGELVALLTEGDVLLAGGQSLLPQFNEGAPMPRRLVDLNAVAELGRWEIGADQVVLGALTRHQELVKREDLLAAVPVLAHAAGHVGHLAVRTRGTLGGSLANADPAAELPGVCLLLEASVRLSGPDGLRSIPVAELLGRLRDREVIVAVELPRPAPGAGWGFRKLSRRGADAFPLVTASAMLHLAADGTVSRARAVVTGAAPAPYAVEEPGLLGRTPGPEWVEEFAELLVDAADPVDDVYATAAFRRRMVRQLASDVLADSRKRAFAGPTEST